MQGPNTQPYHFRVQKTAQIDQCIAAFCLRFQLDAKHAKFAVEGHPVLPHTSVAEAGIRDKDIIMCTSSEPEQLL